MSDVRLTPNIKPTLSCDTVAGLSGPGGSVRNSPESIDKATIKQGKRNRPLISNVPSRH